MQHQMCCFLSCSLKGEKLWITAANLSKKNLNKKYVQFLNIISTFTILYLWYHPISGPLLSYCLAVFFFSIVLTIKCQVSPLQLLPCHTVWITYITLRQCVSSSRRSRISACSFGLCACTPQSGWLRSSWQEASCQATPMEAWEHFRSSGSRSSSSVPSPAPLCRDHFTDNNHSGVDSEDFFHDPEWPGLVGTDATLTFPLKHKLSLVTGRAWGSQITTLLTVGGFIALWQRMPLRFSYCRINILAGLT